MRTSKCFEDTKTHFLIQSKLNQLHNNRTGVLAMGRRKVSKATRAKYRRALNNLTRETDAQRTIHFQRRQLNAWYCWKRRDMFLEALGAPLPSGHTQ
jgi:hypothetical protein